MSDSTTPVKVCYCCGVEKPISDFPKRGDGTRGQCRECRRQYNAEYREKNSARITERQHEWYLDNRERTSALVREWQARNPDLVAGYHRKWYQENREYAIARRREWREKNADRAADYQRKWRSIPENAKRAAAGQRERSKGAHARLANCMSTGMYIALRDRKGGKHWESLVGYTLADLAAHLEAQFTDGMSWDNIGEWHTDHIIPRSLFNQLDEREFRACWSLGNLRPVWGVKNCSKGDIIHCIGKRVRNLTADERADVVGSVVALLDQPWKKGA